jgi:hypothetical protein
VVARDADVYLALVVAELRLRTQDLDRVGYCLRLRDLPVLSI